MSWKWLVLNFAHFFKNVSASHRWIGFGRRRLKNDAKSTSKSVHLRVGWYSDMQNPITFIKRWFLGIILIYVLLSYWVRHTDRINIIKLGDHFEDSLSNRKISNFYEIVTISFRDIGLFLKNLKKNIRKILVFDYYLAQKLNWRLPIFLMFVGSWDHLRTDYKVM